MPVHLGFGIARRQINVSGRDFTVTPHRGGGLLFLQNFFRRNIHITKRNPLSLTPIELGLKLRRAKEVRI